MRFIVYSLIKDIGWVYETELMTEKAALEFARKLRRSKNRRVRVEKIETIFEVEEASPCSGQLSASAS